MSNPVTILLIANLTLAQTNFLQGTVTGVGDGDTITANIKGKSATVRLGCIDAPEMKQTPWGEQSRQRLQQLLPIGIQVQIQAIDTDQYGHIVGVVVTSNTGININLKMISEGQAVVYTPYLNGCSHNQDQYLNAEAKAKEQRLGYWNQENPVMPWDFEREQGSRE